MSKALAQSLIERRKNLETQARAIIDRAESEKRDLSAEEQSQFDQISADMASLRQRSDQLVEFEAESRAAEEALRGAGHRDGQGEEQRGGGRSIAQQFQELRHGQVKELEMRATPEELRALSKGTATAGGDTVPKSFIGRLFEHLIETANLINAGATVITTDSGENLEWPVTTSHGTAAQVAEGGTIGGTDPVFGKRTLGSYKYGELIRVPRELLDDTGVDLEGYLARMAGRALGNAIGAKLVTGTGAGEPLGLMASTTLGATSGTGVAGAPTFDNLIDLFYSVIAPYRNSPAAGWLFKDSTAGTIRKLKDSSGRYLWEASTVADQPDRILSKPVYTDPNVAATAVNAKSIAFGDISAYVVRLVNGIRWERSDQFAFDTDTVVFRAILRGDGVLADQTGAVKHFVGAAT